LVNKQNKSELFSKLIELFSNRGSTQDADLMLEVAKGERKAFERLFNKYKKPIMNYIFQMVKNSIVAEDLTQDVFLKVFKNASQYDSKKKFTTWLWTIAKYTTFDHIKKKKETYIEDMGMTSEDENPSSNVDQVVSGEQTIDDQIINLTDKEIVQRCISKLPDMQQEAIQLRVFSEMSYIEISEVIGKTEKAIKSLINRAKESLKACVKQYA
jgi:RNA polymerase sigma-70 factor (ECF subfamily)